MILPTVCTVGYKYIVDVADSRKADHFREWSHRVLLPYVNAGGDGVGATVAAFASLPLSVLTQSTAIRESKLVRLKRLNYTAY